MPLRHLFRVIPPETGDAQNTEKPVSLFSATTSHTFQHRNAKRNAYPFPATAKIMEMPHTKPKADSHADYRSGMIQPEILQDRLQQAELRRVRDPIKGYYYGLAGVCDDADGGFCVVVFCA